MGSRGNKHGTGTTAVHGAGGRRPGPLTTPVVQSSTFTFASAEEMRRYLDGDDELYLYTRYANPTLQDLEEALAALEGAESALVLSSGMAAMATALITFVASGDEVLASRSLYGGTMRLLEHVLPRFGVTARFLPSEDLARVNELATEKTRLVVLESPTNPTLEIVDIQQVTSVAHEHGLQVIVDNTFATPYLQRPLSLGADLVMHSLTKALAGHSDVVGGALVGRREIVESARDTMKAFGGCMDPHAGFLVRRGLKTLHLRVERQSENAYALAHALQGLPGVKEVAYPGLSTHPGHAVAARQMRAFGGLVTLTLDGGLEAAERLYDRLKVVTRAASLGGVESLVSLPVHTSHHGLDDDQLQAAGIDPGMVRISLGVEEVNDLIEDFQTALGPD